MSVRRELHPPAALFVPVTPTVIIQRELVVAGRRPTTYISRCLAATLMAVLLGTLILFGPNASTAASSRLIFGLIAFTTFAGTLLSGVFLTADALSSERREGTLGLLFLTELRGSDVVIGKLIASSILGAYALVGILPVLAVPLLMGGVTGSEFAATALALCASLLCSLGIGIFASARSRDTAQSMGLTLLILVGMCTLPLLLAWPMAHPWLAPQMSPWIRSFSPYSAVATATSLSQSTATAWPRFLLATGVTSLAGAAGIGLAAHWLTRHWRSATLMNEKVVKSNANPRHTPIHRPPRSYETESPCARWYSLQLQPVRTLAVLSGLGHLAFWGLLGTTVITRQNIAIPSFIAAMFTAYGLHFIFKIQAALHATGALAMESMQGGLELLLSTPLAPAQIIRGHREAVEKVLRLPRITLATVNLGLMAAVLNPRLQISGREAPAFLALFGGGLLLLWVDTYAIARLGPWWALRTRNSGRAVFRTLLISYAPTLVGALLIFLVMASAGGGDPTWVFVSFEVLLAGLAGLAGQYAATRTRRDFRRLASASPIDSKTG